MEKESRVTIKIPRILYNKIMMIIKGSGFNSATDFIIYVLRDVISEKAQQKSKDLTEKELSVIRKRLKNLGYL
jgi:metal-responsive CopG/Arc/MetJ family transcriptional regulator